MAIGVPWFAVVVAVIGGSALSTADATDLMPQVHE